MDVNLQYSLLEKIGMIENLRKFFKNNEININDLVEHLLFDNKRGYIACRDNEVAMVIMSKFAEPLLSNGLPIINVKLDIVIDCVKSIYKDLIKENEKTN